MLPWRWFLGAIYARNKLNDLSTSYAADSAMRDTADDLILIRSRKVAGESLWRRYMWHASHDGAAMKRLCILAQPFLDYELYLLPIVYSAVNSKRWRYTDL